MIQKSIQVYESIKSNIYYGLSNSKFMKVMKVSVRSMAIKQIIELSRMVVNYFTDWLSNSSIMKN